MEGISDVSQGAKEALSTNSNQRVGTQKINEGFLMI